MFWRRLTSRPVRAALALQRSVRRCLVAQRDLLPPEARKAVEDSLAWLQDALDRRAPADELATRTESLRVTATEGLAAFPVHRGRDRVEVLALALVVALALRTFFLQPMRIPTGSMQPTLNGVTVENLKATPDVPVPHGFAAFVERWLYGRTYYEVVAEATGIVSELSAPRPVWRWWPGYRKQEFKIEDRWHPIWGVPDDLPGVIGVRPEALLLVHGGVRPGRVYRAGDVVLRLRVTRGDFMLVDRLTFNFRRPQRGDMAVFTSANVPGLMPPTHYLKRIVALGGERVRIGEDRHLVIDDVRLDRTTPGFERLYTFEGPPRDGEYSGHVNDAVAQAHGLPRGYIAPLFPRSTSVFVVQPRHYLVLGDNTMSSYDSRRWGDLPEENVVGRPWLVYWPVSERFGFRFHDGPR